VWELGGKCIVLHSYSPGLFFLVSVDRSWLRTQARLKTSERYVTSIPTFITRVASELAPNTNRNIRIFCLFICFFLFVWLFIYLSVGLFVYLSAPPVAVHRIALWHFPFSIHSYFDASSRIDTRWSPIVAFPLTDKRFLFLYLSEEGLILLHCRLFLPLYPNRNDEPDW
jgi:hypothetical protein